MKITNPRICLPPLSGWHPFGVTNVVNQFLPRFECDEMTFPEPIDSKFQCVLNGTSFQISWDNEKADALWDAEDGLDGFPCEIREIF